MAGMSSMALSSWAPHDPTNLGRMRSRGSSFGGSFGGSFLGPPPARLSGLYYPTIQQTVVVDGALNGPVEPKEEVKTRRRETIFGPDVGDDDQPGWTSASDGNTVSVDVIRRWVDRAKSEEGGGLHSTTTLQALVNLKRPTLLLQQLEHEADVTTAAHTPSAPLHVLKFTYDAMTPNVRVTLSLHATPVEGVQPQPPRELYSGIHPGGFNQKFTLPSAAAVDLSPSIAPMPPVVEEDTDDDKAAKSTRRPSDDTTRSSIDRPRATELGTIPELHQPEEESAHRRFGLFRRQREPDVEAQIEMTTPPAVEEKAEEEEKKEPEHGMRLLIQLEALGPQAEPLRRRNTQLTHILVSGTWVPDAGSSTTSGTGKRVWVVKVVRREAQIGAHSFLLKEIYGLSSGAGAEPASYPPASGDPYASTPNECIVCLTSPRDVVLLPCRHLVVCRECAVGMVEFGAGGRVARRDDEPTTTGGTEETGALPDATGAAVPVPTPAPAPPPQPRRKKKAKGWYCPVCRQPYTSLLRLALPPSKVSEEPALHRAPSLRSVRTTRSVRSVATLPEGAEAMLSRLAPGGDASDSESEDEHQHAHVHEHGFGGAHDGVLGVNNAKDERPQFVVAEQVGITAPNPTSAAPTAPGAPAPMAASAVATETQVPAAAEVHPPAAAPPVAAPTTPPAAHLEPAGYENAPVAPHAPAAHDFAGDGANPYAPRQNV